MKTIHLVASLLAISGFFMQDVWDFGFCVRLPTGPARGDARWTPGYDIIVNIGVDRNWFDRYQEGLSGPPATPPDYQWFPNIRVIKTEEYGSQGSISRLIFCLRDDLPEFND